MGGKRKNMPKAKRKALAGRGAVGPWPGEGPRHGRDDGQRDLARLRPAATGAKVYTNDAAACRGMPEHEAVNHSVGEYVRGMAHTNGMESFRAMLKRGCHGTFHQRQATIHQRVCRAA